MSTDLPESPGTPTSLSHASRLMILTVAFFGWFCAGMQMSITSLAMRPAAIDLLGRTGQLDSTGEKAPVAAAASDRPGSGANRSKLSKASKELVARWFAWYVCAFLFGAAAGGYTFGRLGDRIGRAKAMSAAILTYSLISGAAYFVQTPTQLLILRFLACMGVGGMWPNGVALVAEAWSELSRPMVAGVIGTSANVGIFLMATIAAKVQITPVEWRWVMLIGAAPVVLGIFSLVAVPESPRWLASRGDPGPKTETVPRATASEVFRPPLLSVTLAGILLATIPLFGGWGSANWMVPWADEAGQAAETPNPFLKANVQQARSLTGMVGSLLGGWIAGMVGRRFCYFAISIGAFASAQYAFWFTVPTDASFLYWVAALGLFSGIYFGWLPLVLPELFPTHVRSTGAGVSFNFGRILTALTVFATGAMIQFFDGDYAKIGRITSCIYLLGMIVIWFAPDTSERKLDD